MIEVHPDNLDRALRNAFQDGYEARQEDVVKIVQSRIDPLCKCPECVEAGVILKLVTGQHVAGLEVW